MKHSPATALPWTTDNQEVIYRQGGSVNHSAVAEYGRQQDAAFIVHAANAYGPLVEALRGVIVDATQPRQVTFDKVMAVLRSLGEAE